MDVGATRYFASVIHEFAQSLGKDRFFLMAEITGSREFAVDRTELTGVDAALGLADVQAHLEATVKGTDDPVGYFSLFRNSELLGKDSHTWLRDTVVTTLGVPCIYYGSEQRLDGQGGLPAGDRYIREAMFGGEFGPFRSRHRHVFDEQGPVYNELARVLALRRQELALRRGRQYLGEVSDDGEHFGVPKRLGETLRGVVAWSRILADRELVCAVNTDVSAASSAWVTVDSGIRRIGDHLHRLYASAPGAPDAVEVEGRNGTAVRLEVPAAAFVVYA